MPSDLSQVVGSTQAVIFDLDGTLVDSSAAICASLNETLATYGAPDMSIDEVRPLIGQPAHALFRRAGWTQGPLMEAAVVRFRERLASRAHDLEKAIDCANELLELLRERDVAIGVATTRPTALALSSLRAAGLLGLIDHVQGTDGFAPKPDPLVVRLCIERLGADKFVMVGDTLDDVWAGRLAGGRTIALCQGQRSPKDFDEGSPDFVVRSTAALYAAWAHLGKAPKDDHDVG